MNTSWYSLVGDTAGNSDHLVSGEWFTVRFIPDHIAGEIFNIGVVFIDEYRNAHYRLLDNADAFSCLFGDKGKANISFLLQVVEDVLKDNHYVVTPSPHIMYSPRQTAQGDSIEEILDDLFGSMISLVCRRELQLSSLNSLAEYSTFEIIVPETTKKLSTNKLRKAVFGRMRYDNEFLYEKIYNKEPYEITNPYSKKKMLIDMPIRGYSGLENQKRQDYYGSVVSAAYISEVHRIHQINYVGATNVMNCCEQLGKSVRTALIIYLPPSDNHTFTKSIRTQAENELDRCLYALHQMSKEGYQIKIEIKDTPEECLNEVLEFVH